MLLGLKSLRRWTSRMPMWLMPRSLISSFGVIAKALFRCRQLGTGPSGAAINSKEASLPVPVNFPSRQSFQQLCRSESPEKALHLERYRLAHDGFAEIAIDLLQEHSWIASGWAAIQQHP